MLITRIITALILIPLILTATLWMSPIYFSLITCVLILVGAWEWSHLIGLTKNISRIFYVVCVAVGCFFAAFVPENVTLMIAAVIWIWAFFAIVSYQQKGSGAGFQYPVVRSFVGFIVLIATWVSIVTLKTDPDLGPNWLIIVMLTIWAADVGGYFAGRAFGKQALCSLVSPKKTWEGFVGGMVFSVIVAAVSGLFLSLSLPHYFAFLGLALVTALFSVVGDLSVSLLKRMTGIKDSGKFFPGHGGMLDRLDSIAAGMVIFVLGALWLV
ncbi:MAG: hypothetical protein A3F13_07120 [Gammaproteobacteria bacterium RIFCSPHIGHO2_12_FULL_40_19]|nr:MAG: hypothetical protein A3F13_07120 [Gammaproteobacteria bacterium RIFCSPHIGHO2_12_FULL_40_19]